MGRARDWDFMYVLICTLAYALSRNPVLDFPLPAPESISSLSSKYGPADCGRGRPCADDSDSPGLQGELHRDCDQLQEAGHTGTGAER